MSDTTITYTQKSDYGIDAVHWPISAAHIAFKSGICQVYIDGFPSQKESTDDATPIATRTVNVTLPSKVFTDLLAALQAEAQAVIDAEASADGDNP